MKLEPQRAGRRLQVLRSGLGEIRIGRVDEQAVAAFDIAGFAQALVERAHTARPPVRRRAAKKPDHRHRSLLRARSERPRGRRAAEKRDELAAFHGTLQAVVWDELATQAVPCPWGQRWPRHPPMQSGATRRSSLPPWVRQILVRHRASGSASSQGAWRQDHEDLSLALGCVPDAARGPRPRRSEWLPSDSSQTSRRPFC
jgi:hypothetical protein